MREQGNSKSRFAGFLKKIGTSLLKLFRGDFLVYLLFLAITFFFWWSQTMSQEFQSVIKLPVRLTGISDDIRVTTPPVGQITVSLNGKGAALRKSVRIGSRSMMHVDNSAFILNQGRASASTLVLMDSITALLPQSVSIRSISPDSLVYTYARQHSIMLPVEFDGTLTTQNQFYMERIEFSPDSIRAGVLISDTTQHHVVADAGQVALSSDTTVRMVPIRPLDGVILNAEQVQMTVIAQQYTEKSLEVPITGVNFPESVSLKAFPSKAELSVWVNLSEYDKVSAADFQVVVDYNDIAGNEGDQVLLRIFSQPVNVRNVRLLTRSVDYLMERKLY